MKSTVVTYRWFLPGAVAILAGTMAVAGCNRASHPDEKSAVTNALKNNNLGAVDVSAS